MPEWKDEIRQRLVGLKLDPAREAEIVEEFTEHLEDRYSELLSSGTTPEEAYCIALAELSESELPAYEPQRVERPVPKEPAVLGIYQGRSMLGDLLQDLRYSIRMLRQSPGFTAVAVLSLALGIGANTAVFSLINNLAFRELHVADPDSLVSLHYPSSSGGVESLFPSPVFEQLRADNHVFMGLFGWLGQSLTIIVSGEPADTVRVGFYSGNYYSVLGVPALLGRTFTPADDRPGQSPVAVISYRYWRTRFSGSLSVLDQTISLQGTPLRIIGVTPPGFMGLSNPAINPRRLALRDNSQDIAIPLVWCAQLRRNNTESVHITARLKPGVTIEQARAELNVIFSRVRLDTLTFGLLEEFKHALRSQTFEVRPAGRGDQFRLESYKRQIAVLMGVVVMVLLIACTNIANLQLARARARQKEIAIRIAVGAGPARLARQLLTESLLLAALGGAVGLWFAILAHDALNYLLQLSGDFTLDWRVLGFVAGISLLTVILFGLGPAFRSMRIDISASLKERVGGKSRVSAGRRFGIGKALVVFQVSLSLMLMIIAGLLVRSIQNLNRVDPGFDPENVLLFWVRPGILGYRGVAEIRLYEEFLRRFKDIPGVLQASMMRHNLMQGAENFERVSVAGNSTSQNVLTQAAVNRVAPGFFAAMRIPLLAGRDFSANDTERAFKVAIVNQRFVKNHLSQESPLGKRIIIGDPASSEEIEIIGVASDTRYYSLQQHGSVPGEEIYLPYTQVGELGQMCFALRTASSPMNLLGAVRLEAQAVEKNLPIAFPTTQAEVVQQTIREERSLAVLTSFFGMLAVLLAGLGLYGVMSYSVARRTNEIGIRLALGATRRDILWLILRETQFLVVTGVAIGLPTALAAARLITNLLFGLTPADPVTLFFATLLLAAVAALAGFLPARRASQVDPMAALRCE